MDINIEFDYLKNHTDAISELAKYSFDTWRPVYEQAKLTYNDVVSSFSERINTDKLPLALVVLESGDVIGTGSLKIQDLDIRPDYSPWLGGMYVIEKYRGKGIGSLLIEHLLLEAKKLQLNSLYLWTPYSVSLYQRHAWKILEKDSYCGYEISIMHRSLD